jgi:hypothetical protein
MKRAFPLPFGYSATFAWTGQSLDIPWRPALPHIEKRRAQRRFFEAYKAARRDFITELPAVLGGKCPSGRLRRAPGVRRA